MAASAAFHQCTQPSRSCAVDAPVPRAVLRVRSLRLSNVAIWPRRAHRYASLAHPPTCSRCLSTQWSLQVEPAVHSLRLGCNCKEHEPVRTMRCAAFPEHCRTRSYHERSHLNTFKSVRLCGHVHEARCPPSQERRAGKTQS
jgi:hypothetical protein